MMEKTFSGEQYDELREKLVKHMTDFSQPGGAWFPTEELFDEWAGDAFDAVLMFTLEELGFELDF